MKRFLIDILKFGLLALILLLSTVIITGESHHYIPGWRARHSRNFTGHMLTRIAEADTSGPVDILFLGSSQVYRGIDPRIFSAKGYKVLVLGSRAQTPLQSRLLLDRYLSRTGPSLVVIDVFPLTFMDLGIESAVDIIHTGPIDGEVLNMAWKLRSSHIWKAFVLRYFHKITRGDPTEERLKPNGDEYIDGGFVERKEAPYRSTVSRTLQKWHPPAHQLEAFEAMLNRLREEGVPYVLVHAPVTDQYRYSEKDREVYKSFISNYGPFIDLSDLLNDTIYFSDPYHLNSDGVRIYNKELIRELEAQGAIDRSYVSAG